MKTLLLYLLSALMPVICKSQSLPAELDSVMIRNHGIKSVVISHKTIDPLNGKTTIQFQQLVQFDSHANLITDLKATGHKRVYSYDKNNRLVKSEFYTHDSTLKGFSVHKYEGKNISLHYYEDSLLKEEEFYIFSSSGKLIRQIHKEKGEFYSESRFTYDMNDSLVTRTYISRGSSATHDKNGQLTEIIKFRGSKDTTEIISRRTYKYNPKGKISAQKDSTKAGIREVHFIYNDDGDLIRTFDQDGNILFDAEKIKKATEDKYIMKGYDPIEENPEFTDPYTYPKNEEEKEKRYNRQNLLISKLIYTDREGRKTYEVYEYK